MQLYIRTLRISCAKSSYFHEALNEARDRLHLNLPLLVVLLLLEEKKQGPEQESEHPKSNILEVTTPSGFVTSVEKVITIIH